MMWGGDETVLQLLEMPGLKNHSNEEEYTWGGLCESQIVEIVK